MMKKLFPQVLAFVVASPCIGWRADAVLTCENVAARLYDLEWLALGVDLQHGW